MFKKTLAAAVAASVLVATPAGAHVTLQPNTAPAGAFKRLDVRVPNESDTASTKKVEVQFPPGFVFLTYEPVPGWKVEIEKRKLDEPVEVMGEERTEEIGGVTMTATGDGIAPGQFQDFGLSLRLPEQAGEKLTFKSLQTYSDGEVVRWIGEPDSEKPAPQVTLTEAEGGHGGGHGAAAGGKPGSGDKAATEPASSEGAAGAAAGGGDDGDGDGAPTWLVVAALVAGLLGLGAGAGGLLTARRARTA